MECCQSGKDVESILIEYRNGLQHWENFNEVFVSQKNSQCFLCHLHFIQLLANILPLLLSQGMLHLK